PELPPAPPAPTPRAETSAPPDFLSGPSTPAPQPQPRPQAQTQTQPQPPPQLRVQTPPPAPTSPSTGLILPRASSPGRAVEQSAEQAPQGGGITETFSGPLPRRSGGLQGGGGFGGGGGVGGEGSGSLQMLTPTEGVDFNDYLARVLASVKRNWYSIM